eukprot:PhM_4_TR4229/c0_g2_i1/m.5891
MSDFFLETPARVLRPAEAAEDTRHGAEVVHALERRLRLLLPRPVLHDGGGGAGHVVQEAVGAAHEHVLAGSGRARQRAADHVGRDVAGLALPLGARLVDGVRDLEALGVRLHEAVELVLEEDVALGAVAVQQLDLGLVAGVAGDGADQLKHGRDADAAADHVHLVVRVGLVLERGRHLGPLERVADLEVRHARRHVAVGVALDHDVEVAVRVVGRDGGVVARDALAHAVVEHAALERLRGVQVERLPLAEAEGHDLDVVRGLLDFDDGEELVLVLEVQVLGHLATDLAGEGEVHDRVGLSLGVAVVDCLGEGGAATEEHTHATSGEHFLFFVSRENEKFSL